MRRKARQSALRRWRISEEGLVYSITTCVERGAPALIRTPLDPKCNTQPAEIVIECVKWLHENGRVRCDGVVIMPDHVHMVLALVENQTLAGVMRTFGSYSARRINEMSGRRGRYWQKGFYERCVRDVEGFLESLQYMNMNPVRKGFVDRSEDWPHTLILPGW
jgi:putative transposase